MRAALPAFCVVEKVQCLVVSAMVRTKEFLPLKVTDAVIVSPGATG